MSFSVLGLDVGGANLKMAHVAGFAVQRPFPLWKQPNQLAAALRDLLVQSPPFDRLAMTMTGELCDCFETKRQGVGAILDAVREAAGDLPVFIWTTNGRFVDPAAARHEWLTVAAANWYAAATWAGRFTPTGGALLIDAGSTTTDIIPLWNGKPIPDGLTDPDRLKSGELVYTGARRTPVCALLHGEGMAELFATTLDVCLLLERRPDAPDDCDTADGRPATRAFAHARLARMLGGDGEMTSIAETRHLAEQVAKRQTELILTAATRVAARLPQKPSTLLTAGSGEHLIDDAIALDLGLARLKRISLSATLGPAISHAVCAYAVAILASET
jgi:probable H4MPT-linked C1 transfer pathway protein